MPLQERRPAIPTERTGAPVGARPSWGDRDGVSPIRRRTPAPRVVRSPQQDREVLRFLLLIDQTQAALYEQAVERGSIDGELLEFARVAGGHEPEHVALLREALGPRRARAAAARLRPRHDRRGNTLEQLDVMMQLGVVPTPGQE
jgi:hypothetical protein